MNFIKMLFGGSSNRPNSKNKKATQVVREGDTSLGLTARKAKVVSVKTTDNYMGYKDFTVQTFVIRRKDGKEALGQQFIDYRGTSKEVAVYKPVKVGDSVIAWWPDKRRGINYASLPNLKKKK